MYILCTYILLVAINDLPNIPATRASFSLLSPVLSYHIDCIRILVVYSHNRCTHFSFFQAIIPIFPLMPFDNRTNSFATSIVHQYSYVGGDFATMTKCTDNRLHFLDSISCEFVACLHFVAAFR